MLSGKQGREQEDDHNVEDHDGDDVDYYVEDHDDEDVLLIAQHPD